MGRAEKSQSGDSFSVNCADPSRRMAMLAVFLFSLGLAAAQPQGSVSLKAGRSIGSGPPDIALKGKNPNPLNGTSSRLRVAALAGLATVGKSGGCNDLEELINRERRSDGLSSLHCDPHMRWVANNHLFDAEEGANENLAWGDEC